MLPLDLCYVIHLGIIVWPGHWKGIWCTKPQTCALNPVYQYDDFFLPVQVTVCFYVCVRVVLYRFFLQFFIPTARTLTEAEVKIFISAADGNSDGRLGVDGLFLIFLNCLCMSIYCKPFSIGIISGTSHLHWPREPWWFPACLHFSP